MREEIEYKMFYLETSNKIILLLPNEFHRYTGYEDQKWFLLHYLLDSNINKIHIFIAQRHTVDLSIIINLLSEIRNKRNDIRIIIHCSDKLMLELYKDLPSNSKILDDIYEAIFIKGGDFCYWKITWNPISKTIGTFFIENCIRMYD